MRIKEMHISNKIKKLYIIAILMFFCFMGLVGCQNEKKVLFDDFVSEDNSPKIFIEKRSPICVLEDWPKSYDKVWVQYESIWKENDDLNVNSVSEKFYEGGEWEYVDISLYLDGRDTGVYYSLCDLTNDGFPELIIGTWNAGVYVNGQWEEGFYNPYAMYYYNTEKDKIEYYSYGGFPTTFYEEGVTLSIGSGMSKLMMFSQFQNDTQQWEGVAEVGMKWEDGEFIGYYKDDNDRKTISEEEYYQIINKYSTKPIELEWYPLDFEQTN